MLQGSSSTACPDLELVVVRRDMDASDTTGSVERRSHQREPAFHVRASLRMRHDASVINLAPKGVGIETTTWLAVGRPYRFRVEVVGEKEPIFLRGVVDWCRLNRTERQSSGEAVSIYRAGIGLVAMEDRSRTLTPRLSESISTSFRSARAGIELECSILC